MTNSNKSSGKRLVDIRYDTMRNMIRLNGKFYGWDDDVKQKGMLVEMDVKKSDALMRRILDGMDGVIDGRQILRFCLSTLMPSLLVEIDEMIKAGIRCKPVLNIENQCIELRIGTEVITIMLLNG